MRQHEVDVEDQPQDRGELYQQERDPDLLPSECQPDRPQGEKTDWRQWARRLGVQVDESEGEDGPGDGRVNHDWWSSTDSPDEGIESRHGRSVGPAAREVITPLGDRPQPPGVPWRRQRWPRP